MTDENADIVRTVEAIKALVEEEKQNLPDTIAFLYTNDVSISVRDKFDIVKNNDIMGLVLMALVVLSAFLNIRSSFWVALSIPFSMLGVLILLPLFDVDLDSITMTAMVIVIGIIVDDAIVISENIFQRREKAMLRWKPRSMACMKSISRGSFGHNDLTGIFTHVLDEGDDGQICVCHSFNHYIGFISLAVQISADSAGRISCLV